MQGIDFSSFLINRKFFRKDLEGRISCFFIPFDGLGGLSNGLWGETARTLCPVHLQENAE